MRSTSETHVAGLLRKAQAFNDIGDRSATYKAALLMTLAQLAVEKGHDDGDRFFFAPATLYVVPSIKYDVVADRGGRDRADRDRERPDALVSNKHYNAGCFGPLLMNPTSPPPTRDAFLMAVGETIRTARARRGMTRRMLATEAGVSERHLANLESGLGNASILVLRQVAQALGCPLAELVDAKEGSSPEAALLRDLLRDRSEHELQRARIALARLFGAQSSEPERRKRIALIGLRGAGKSTLGRLLADQLGVAFVELNREIERVAGCSVTEIHALYGLSAYRRYERRALDDIIQRSQPLVIATPGGLVSEAGTFNRLLEHCFTVWLKTSPQEHMDRVIAQGDNRPMAGNAEAMDDLRRILAGRSPFYAKADLTFDTSGQSLEQTLAGLREAIDFALAAEVIAGD